MPTYTISVINETFSSSSDHEGPSLEAAETQALKAALAIGVDEVAGGKPYFGAEVKVATSTGTFGRFVVSVGASRLHLDGQASPRTSGS